MIAFGMVVYYFYVSRTSSIDSVRCESGKFDSVTPAEFLNINQSEEDLDFVGRAKGAVMRSRTEIEDLELNSVLISTGLSSPKGSHTIYYYLVSKTENVNVTYSNNQIIHRSDDQFAYKRFIITYQILEQVLFPYEAVQIAVPYLNCHKDYKKNTARSARLMYSDQDGVLVWIIRVEDEIMSIPGPNVSHIVKMNAVTGEVIQHR